jgi:hypothetical protein
VRRRWTAILASIVAFGLVTMLGVLLVFRPVAEVDPIPPPWPPPIAIGVYLLLSVFLLDWAARRMRSSYSAAFVIAAAQSILIVDLLARGERGLMTAAAGISIVSISWASAAFVHSRLSPKHRD